MNRSPLLDLHRAAGARLTQGDPPELLTYGDVPAEYRAANEGAVLFDATERARVVARGADAPSFLHRLLANDVRNLAVGGAQRNLLLSSKGKVLFEFELRRGESEVELEIAASKAKALLAALDLYLFSEKVTFADETELAAPIELAGPRAVELARSVCGAAVPAEPGRWTTIAWNGATVRASARAVAGASGLMLDAGAAHAQALWNALRAAGAVPAGRIVRDILRVEAGAAEYGLDVDENVYPQEARLEPAFSLTKGCYIGQEVVAKIDTYGGLNKRLVALKVAHDDPVARGTRLMKLDEGEWRDLGVVTSWAYSFVLDTGLVLAYVKRRHQKAGTEFRLGDGPATAVIVPLPVRANALAVTGEFE
ncbi:MAG: aminomethyl transferase family protein [Planctomycetes bacterium]|nr:aminomethyl transferase family protein [Planctomycetota bacterium]